MGSATAVVVVMEREQMQTAAGRAKLLFVQVHCGGGNTVLP